MLTSLFIRNYAIIKELKIDFREGLSTMTGETGAGKSILLDALSLLLGERADTAVLQDKSARCIVEGIFNNNLTHVQKLLRENDIGEDQEIIIRREISNTGKSRAFVNDTPVNLQFLKEIGLLLVDIHSQHENLNLSRPDYQLEVIDAYAGLGGKTEIYREKFSAFKKIQAELRQLSGIKAESLARLDFISFQFEELEKAKLQEGELAQAEAEMEMLQHSEEIKASLFLTWKNLNGEEINVISLLRESAQALTRIKAVHPPASLLSERIESVIIELKDLASEAESLAEKSEFDPDMLEKLQGRTNLLNLLLQKHQLKSDSELILLREKYRAEISEIENMEFRLDGLAKKMETAENELMKLAEEMSASRSRASNSFTQEITRLLVELGIPNARFLVEIEKTSELTENGTDRLRFMFTANRSTQVQELSKVASGGELSRLMLSIKSVISHALGLPTIIFDEIDTGVSGEIAHRIGSLMKKMADDRQVLAVTHLPQVAACGTRHYYVYKEDKAGNTETLLRELSEEERVTEIAKMLSGEATTEAAIKNARELLKY